MRYIGFFIKQLDYVYFIYGLAFAILAIAAFFIGQHSKNRLSWRWLFVFGFLHAINEWLDLLVLNTHEALFFNLLRTAILAVSFVALFEFGRVSYYMQRKRTIPLWIRLALLALMFSGLVYGLNGFKVTIRYSYGFIGAALSAVVLFDEAHREKGRLGRLLLISSIAMAVYSVASGLVTPRAPFFPASILNYDSFLSVARLPVQIIRCILAVIIGICVWKYYRTELLLRVVNLRRPKAFFADKWAPLLLFLILSSGWVITNFLGGFGYRQDKRDNEDIFRIIDEGLAFKSGIADRVAQAMAKSPYLMSLTDPEKKNQKGIDTTLDRYSRILVNSVCYVMDRDGTTVGASNRNAPDSFVGSNYSIRPYFLDAVQGLDGRFIAIGMTSKIPGYYSCSAVRNADGGIIGAAAVKVNLDHIIEPPSVSGGNIMIVHDSGVVISSYNPEWYLKLLWPVDEYLRSELIDSKQFPVFPEKPVFSDAPHDGMFKYFKNKLIGIFIKDAKIKGLKIISISPLNLFFLWRLIGIGIIFSFIIFSIIFIVILELTQLSNLIIADSEQKYRSVIENIQDVFYRVDIDGKLIMVSPSCAYILGYKSIDEMMRKSPVDFWLSAGTRKLLVSELKRKREVTDWEFKVKKNDGTVLTASANIKARYDGDGVFIGYEGTWRDITARKEQEEALSKAKEAAVVANQAKSRFLSNVSHELRTPLNCVIGFAEEILRTESAEKIHGYAKVLLKEAGTLLSLINMLLDAAKIEAKKLTLDPAPMDLTELMSVVEANTRLLLEGKEVDLKVEISGDVPRAVVGDKLRIRQVLMNLAANAVKFTKKGHIIVKVALLQSDGKKARIRFSVEDTGIGISKEKHEFIFQRFAQINAGETEKQMGTGLGTNIAHELVELMKGKIDFESEFGKGSTFWFELDMQIAAQAEKEITPKTPEFKTAGEYQRTGALLIAEDYETNRQVLLVQLADTGYTVDTVQDGEEAVKACSGKIYDVVLMDIQMPKVDGLTAAKQIRGLPDPFNNIPIIAMTASSDEETKKLCIESGMNDLLPKPIMRDALLSILNKWAGKPAVSNKIEEAINYTKALEMFAGNKKTLDEILKRLVINVEDQLVIIDKAAADEDMETLRSEAHKIKGGALSVAAGGLSRSARNLEEACRSGKKEDTRISIEDIKKEFGKFKERVNNIIVDGRSV